MLMVLKERAEVLVGYVVLVFCVWSAGGQVAEAYAPWDNLTADSWIDFLSAEHPRMYPVNCKNGCSDTDPNYPIAFLQAAAGNRARGMNALRFVHAGQTSGRMVSADPAGSFGVGNFGADNYFSSVLLVVAIYSGSLPGDFSFSLGMSGRQPYQLGPGHFSYYDNPFGRPSGYYSVTDPNGEDLTYAFSTGMVVVYDVDGLSSFGPGQTITIDYSFNNLPGPAVFSVYGFVGSDPEPSIYHTNRAIPDNNDPDHKPVSTFAVTVPGDLNGDLKVDLADFALFSGNWLVGPGS
jgi:hypothetical protein